MAAPAFAAGDAALGESQNVAPSEQSSPALDRILAAWKARQEHTKTFHCEWTLVSSNRPPPTDRVILLPPPDHAVERPPGQSSTGGMSWSYRMQGSGKFRSEVRSKGNLDLLVGNGETVIMRSHGGGPEVQNWPADVPFHRQSAAWYFPEPLLLFYRPLDRKSEWQFRTDNAVVGGRRFTKIERTVIYKKPRSSQETRETFWVDPTRGDLPMHWEESSSGSVQAISFEYAPHPKLGWNPSGWIWQRMQTTQRLRYESRFQATSISINEPIDPVYFEPVSPEVDDLFDGLKPPAGVRARSKR